MQTDGVLMQYAPISSGSATALCDRNGITPFFMYHTFSNSDDLEKYRIVLILDQPITDKQEAAELTARFADIFNKRAPGAADTTMSDAARLIFGGKHGCTFNITEQVTPLQVLRQLPPVRGQEPQQVTMQTDTQARADDPDGADLDWINETEKQRALDWLQKWADENGVTLGKRYSITAPPHAGATAICVQCPWKHEHGDTTAPNESVILIEQTGKRGYLCRHAHCRGKGWHDYRAEIERRTSSLNAQRDRAERPQSDFDGQKVSTDSMTANGAENAKENADDLTRFISAVQRETFKPRATGLPFFDRLLGGGITPQSLLLLLAAPAAGKTTLCAQVAESIAERGEPFIYFNLEMSTEQMLAKSISRRLNERGVYMSAKQVLQGYKWSDQERQEVTAEIEKYRQTVYPYLKYNPDRIGTRLEDILEYLEEKGSQAKANGQPAPAVVIDYLHLLTSSTTKDPAEIIKEAVSRLKQYAIKYETFVIAISAVNSDSTKSGIIGKYSGRDTSGIEFTGDYIITINYEELLNGDAKPNTQKFEELKKAAVSNVVLRLEKGRFDQEYKKARVKFNKPHNKFEATEISWTED